MLAHAVVPSGETRMIFVQPAVDALADERQRAVDLAGLA